MRKERWSLRLPSSERGDDDSSLSPLFLPCERPGAAEPTHGWIQANMLRAQGEMDRTKRRERAKERRKERQRSERARESKMSFGSSQEEPSRRGASPSRKKNNRNAAQLLSHRSPPLLFSSLLFSTLTLAHDAVQDHDDAHALRYRRAQGEFSSCEKDADGGGDSGRGRTESCLLCFASFCRRRLFAVSLHFRGMLSLSGARFTRIRVPRMRCRQAPSPDAVRTREKCADSSVRPRPFSRSISYIFFLFFCSRRRTKLEFTIDRPSPPPAAPSSPSAPRPSTPALTPRSKR